MAYDFKSSIHQSLADKLVNSVSYPHVVLERKDPYESLALAALPPSELEDEAVWIFDDSTNTELLTEVGKPYSYEQDRSEVEEENIAGQTRQALNEIAKNAQECLAALTEFTNSTQPDKPEWDGPDEVTLLEIIATAQAEVPDLAKLRALGDWDITALVTWIRVTVRNAPTFRLGGASIKLEIKIACDGTGEAWLKHPWVKCVKKWHGICYKWKKITKWTRILSVTLRGIKVHAEATAEFFGKGPRVLCQGKFDKLRLDHRYLDKIPLEKLANNALSHKPITIYDATKLIATVPVLESKFTVDTISLPTVANEILVEVSLRQI